MRSLRWFIRETGISKKELCVQTLEAKTLIWLFLFSQLLYPNFSWSAQPTVRMAQPATALAYLPVYAARANGYFKDEGVALELILVQGGADLAALIGGSVDFDATNTGGLLRVFSGGTELWGVHNILGKCIVDLVIRKDAAKRLGITPTMPVQERLKRIKGTVIGTTGIATLTYQIAYFLAKEVGLEPGKDVILLSV